MEKKKSVLLLFAVKLNASTFKAAVATDVKPCAFQRHTPLFQRNLPPEFVGYTSSGLAVGE